MPRSLVLKKLCDHFGDYTLVIVCSKCGYRRFSDPHTLARTVGWDTPVEKFALRLKCTRCGANNPLLSGEASTRPRGVPKSPH
jgi:ribosomal protein L44E